MLEADTKSVKRGSFTMPSSMPWSAGGSSMVTTRRARYDDFEVVSRLLTELGRTPLHGGNEEWFRSIYRAQIEDPSCCHLVAELDGSVVGFCSLHFRHRLNRVRPEGWIPDLIVDPAVRRRGVGRALLQEAARRSRAAGCFELDLESGAQRREAHEFYRSAGMAEGLAFVLRL
jgi:ribosomal protein S18 acetylase RimI-like enzyme